ncbi:MAG TPA: hypothetical protein VLF66_14700 [Thermoanaerobaculia bacterium]|nr:hypothetical protein [Thermoanaerobaculia bacterium]
MRFYLAEPKGTQPMARSESVERLREAWESCRSPFGTVAMWLRVLGETMDRDPREAETVALRLASEERGKPLERLNQDLSVALERGHRRTASELREIVKLFALTAFRYREGSDVLLQLGHALHGDGFFRMPLYVDLYEEHQKCLDELRRMIRRSDTTNPEFESVVGMLRDLFPTPPVDSPPSRSGS